MRKLQDYIFLFLKGVCMGGVDVLLGVSGGTVVFVTGLYEEWIESLNAIDKQALLLLREFKFNAFWKKINGTFLCIIIAGIALGLLLTGWLVNIVIQHYPIRIKSFFFGLILITAPLMLRTIKKWNAATLLAFVIGASIAYLLTVVHPLKSPDSLWFIVLCGFITSIGMLWPAASCSFILILLGKYQYILNAFGGRSNIGILILFLIGWFAGLLSLSRITRSLLDHYHHAAIALLAGMMVGALNKMWPWRETLEYVTNSKGEQVPAFDKSVLPWNYLAITGKYPQVFQAILMMALGVFIVVLTEKIAARLKTKI